MKFFKKNLKQKFNTLYYANADGCIKFDKATPETTRVVNIIKGRKTA